MKINLTKLSALFLFLGAGLSGVFSSCKQDYADVDGMAENGLYVAPRQAYFQYLSSSTSYNNYPYGVLQISDNGIAELKSGEVSADTTQLLVNVRVNVAGPLSSTPLQLKMIAGDSIVYSENASHVYLAAISGTDYVPLADTYTIPADSTGVTIPIRFNRSAIEQAGDQGKELILQLVPSDDLQTRVGDQRYYVIRVIDDLLEPLWWQGYGLQGMNILGVYSKRKYQLLLSKLPTNFLPQLVTSAYSVNNISQVARAAVELSQEHPDLDFPNASRFLP